MAISLQQNKVCWVVHSGPSSVFPGMAQGFLAFVNRLTYNLHICALCVCARLMPPAFLLLLFQKYVISPSTRRIIFYLGYVSALICKVISPEFRSCIKANAKRAIQGVHACV